MNRRIWLSLCGSTAAALVMVLGFTGGASGAPANNPTSKFTAPAGVKLGKISNPANLPLALSNKSMGYILELGAKPVAAVAASSSRPLTKAQKSRITAQLKRAQAPVAAAVRNLGGTVTESYQGVYNGIAVRVPARLSAQLGSIPGVTGVFATRTFHLATSKTSGNAAPSSPGDGIPLTGAPDAWGSGFAGQGMKIADIDTGIDYTHADFGGPGTTAAWNYAVAHSTVDPATDPTLAAEFGPNAPKVKGGWDFVGDNYNANGSGSELIPQPDPNPLDCNSHGTHTAGTAAGFGVLSNGSTYTGSYDANTIANNSFLIPPGMAPKASIYALRVFGCSGSVDDSVLIAAMNWAYTHGMDAVNMSLGADFGTPNDPDSVAATNLANAGVIVVSASGNAGNSPFITSSPAAGTGGIAAAASDPTQQFPGATVALTGGSLSSETDITAIDANGYALPSGSFNVAVVWNNPADHTQGISLGCSVADDGGANSLPANTFIVVERGTCARVAKAIYGQEAGAAGVIMINNDPGYPPYEGPITSNPDTGDPYTVTIPFLGVQGTESNYTALTSADGGSLSLTATTVDNPNYLGLASFTSWGPAGNGALAKPEVTAPGVSIVSAGMGTGNGILIDSGTSMATPHTSGMALLVKQAHPTWKGPAMMRTQYWKDAIVNTANAGLIGVGGADYATRGAGGGMISAYDATHTQVVASGFPNGMASINFGMPPITHDMTARGYMRLHNFGTSAATFNLGTTMDQGYDHSVSFFTMVNHQPMPVTQVTVPARGNLNVGVELDVPFSSAVAPLDQWCDWYGCNDTYNQFDDISGLVTLTPATTSDNGNIPLTVAYYSIPTAASSLRVRVNTSQLLTANKQCAPHATCGLDLPTRLSNGAGAYTYADFLPVGGVSPVSQTDIGSADLLYAGIGTYFEGYSYVGLKVNQPWTNIAEDEFDVLIDVNGDGIPDYDVFSYDYGALTTGVPDGIPVTFAYSFATGELDAIDVTYAAFNGTTAEMPLPWEYLCMDSSPCIGDSPDGSLSYVVESFDRNGGSDMIGSFNNDGSFATTADPINLAYQPFYVPAEGNEFYVNPHQTINTYAHIDTWAWGQWPQEGIMSINYNNRARNNAVEATFVPISLG